jgi:phosphoglycerate dehydrogenase-like enzyme
MDRATREGRGWPSDPELGDTVRDLGGCTVGLVGYGNIAKRVERILAAMGTTVLHTSTKRDDEHRHLGNLPDLLTGATSSRCTCRSPRRPEAWSTAMPWRE